MGYGGYSYEAHQAITKARSQVPVQNVFRQKQCHPLMSPNGVKVRESRDSVEHPSSVPIIFALDVTGSMGAIPEQLARKELPTFMKTLIDYGIRDPQVLFMAVGDAFYDNAPLQIGQFESTAELMDQWLTWSWLEGSGGQGGHESYDLALYFVARHIDTDAYRKRQRRGYLILTGDEKPYPLLSRQIVRSVIGDELDEDLPVSVVVDEAQRMFEPFFLIPDLDRRARCERVWRDVLGDRVICMENPGDVCAVAAALIGLTEGSIAHIDALAQRLSLDGLDRPRVGAVIRAVLPWAAALERDRAPRPAIDSYAALPIGDAPSEMRRSAR